MSRKSQDGRSFRRLVSRTLFPRPNTILRHLYMVLGVVLLASLVYLAIRNEVATDALNRCAVAHVISSDTYSYGRSSRVLSVYQFEVMTARGPVLYQNRTKDLGGSAMVGRAYLVLFEADDPNNNRLCIRYPLGTFVKGSTSIPPDICMQAISEVAD